METFWLEINLFSLELPDYGLVQLPNLKHCDLIKHMHCAFQSKVQHCVYLHDYLPVLLLLFSYIDK